MARALKMELDLGLSLCSTYLLTTAKFIGVRWEILLVLPTSMDSCEEEMRCNGQTHKACRAPHTQCLQEKQDV